MPHADLPHGLLGWLVAIAASMVGFLAGLAFMHVAANILDGQ